jgi:formylglycine-generating enzyme required for sulfatase activity
VDGTSAGVTPVTAEVGAGNHELAVQLAGYKTWRQPIVVTANEPQKLADVKLGVADTRLHVTSTPVGATVTVDGSYRGQTPIDLPLAPGVDHRLDLSAPGYQAASRTVQLQRDAGSDLDVKLDPILGTVVVSMTPADATLLVDGKAQAAGTTRLSLTATTHRLEARKSGFTSFTTTVTPRPSFEQRVDIALATEAEKKVAATASRITAAGGGQLVLVQPGTFRMGSERGTQGRQSNEVLKPVKLSRAFYLGATEVTNAQFKQFEAGHTSGIVARETLDNDTQPVVRVTWEQAAKYCNWLSTKDGLTPAYKDDGTTLSLIEPVGTGYRLPTEAEWEWAARFAKQSVALRYPWGASLPPPPGAGNYADARAGNLAGTLIAGYDDGFAGSAPVGRFAPNVLGIFDLGGNVAEWTNDRYDATFLVNPQETVDPYGAKTGTEHVIRGASFLHGRVIELRLAYRDFGHEDRMDVGFRVARYAE